LNPLSENYMPLTKGSQLVGTAGKIAGIPMGPIQLYRQLRKDKVLINGGLNHNVPYQKFIDAKLFEVFGRYIKIDYGKEGMVERYVRTTAVTPRGVAWLRKKYGTPPDIRREVVFAQTELQL